MDQSTVDAYVHQLALSVRLDSFRSGRLPYRPLCSWGKLSFWYVQAWAGRIFMKG